ncbi:MAG: hypothetical protein ABIH03_01065 [Pseudomonadota bacterium]
MTKLTPTMERVLAEVRRRRGLSTSAFHLRCSVATLEALRRRGLIEVERSYDDGSLPYFDVYYRAVEEKV